MDRPTLIGPSPPITLAGYQLVTIAANSAANLQTAIEKWRFGLASTVAAGSFAVYGFEVGASGDGGVFYAVITTGFFTGEPEESILIERAIFIIRDGGTGDNANALTTAGGLDPTIQPPPTGAVIQGTFIEDPLFDPFEPVLFVQIFEFSVAGCNAGRRFVLGMLFEAFGGGPSAEELVASLPAVTRRRFVAVEEARRRLEGADEPSEES